MKHTGKKFYILSIILSVLYTGAYFGTLVTLLFNRLHNTYPPLPYILTAIALFPIVFSLLNAFLFQNVKFAKALAIISVFFILFHILFCGYALSKLMFALIAAIPVFAIFLAVLLVVFFVKHFPKFKPAAKAFSVIGIVAAAFCLVLFGICGYRPFAYTSDGVVFAVEDEYQIAWSTSVPSAGYVTIGDKSYDDASAGAYHISTLHKVSVPMSELDSVKGYTLHSVPSYTHEAYLSIHGKEECKSYTFRPVDTSDGLQAYAVSDNHEILPGAINAASYYGDDLDVLILNGDHINDLSTKFQISLIYKLASGITHGTRPVIFVRGNHECNGTYAAEFHNYVGSYEGNLYYRVKLGNAYFLVLDTTNDMEDDHILIKPASNYAPVREAQLAWLEGLEDPTDCEYKILLSHMPFPLKNYERYPEWTKKAIELTNDKFDICISGHSHMVDFAEAGTETNSTYPVVRDSIRTERQMTGEGISAVKFTGTAIECKDGKITVAFTTTNHEPVETPHVVETNR